MRRENDSKRQCVCVYVCMCMAVAENSSTSTWQKRHCLPSTTPNIGWKCSSCSRWLSPQRRESAYSEIILGMVRQKWQTGDFPVTRPEVRRKGARFSFVSRHTKRKVPKTLDCHWHNAYGPTSLSLCLFEDGLVVCSEQEMTLAYICMSIIIHFDNTFWLLRSTLFGGYITIIRSSCSLRSSLAFLHCRLSHLFGAILVVYFVFGSNIIAITSLLVLNFFKCQYILSTVQPLSLVHSFWIV
jgi:hypothetical protein